MTVHLRLDGTWATCEASRRACPRAYHIMGMDLTQVNLVPLDFLETLLGERIGGEPSLHHGFEANSIQMWCDADGRQHRDYDLPAVIDRHGADKWYQHGKLHRGHDLPAVIYPDGTQEWWVDGVMHREHGPARLAPDGTQTWRQHGQQHRADGPAEIMPGVGEFWFFEGQPHRGGGLPSHTYYADGWQEWWEHGRMVRHGHGAGTDV